MSNEHDMSSLYIMLLRLTDRGALDPSPMAEKLAQTLGALDPFEGVLLSVDATLGEFDYIVRIAGLEPSEMLAVTYYVAREGMFRTTTLAASPQSSFDTIQQLVPPAPVTPKRYT